MIKSYDVVLSGDAAAASYSGNDASSSNGANGSRGASPAGSFSDPKVPPLKIILHGNNVSSDVKTRVHESVHSAKQVSLLSSYLKLEHLCTLRVMLYDCSLDFNRTNK